MIYILEDDDSIRKLVTYALESQGYEKYGELDQVMVIYKKIP